MYTQQIMYIHLYTYLISISVESDGVIENLPPNTQSTLKVVVKAVEVPGSVSKLGGGKVTLTQHFLTLGK